MYLLVGNMHETVLRLHHVRRTPECYNLTYNPWHISVLFIGQEVSAFGDDGEGDILDDWTVLCNGEFWQRDEEVRFKHASTNVLLSVTGEQYGRPINGQREVHGMTYASQHNFWKAMEGIFMKPSEPPRTDFTHSELWWPEQTVWTSFSLLFLTVQCWPPWGFLQDLTKFTLKSF